MISAIIIKCPCCISFVNATVRIIRFHGVACVGADSVYPELCASSAAFSSGASSFPLSDALRKIPRQAFGGQGVFARASFSKIRDKKQAFSPLGKPKIGGIVYAPSDISSLASYQLSVFPSSRFRHWNITFCERFAHHPTPYGYRLQLGTGLDKVNQKAMISTGSRSSPLSYAISPTCFMLRK